jgi:hypothetical protein
VSKRHRLSLLVAVLALGGGALLWWAVNGLWSGPHSGRYDVNEKSTDIQRDLKLMWETQRLGGAPDPTHPPNPRASTDRAVQAASRGFNSVELFGKKRAEVITLLGDPKTANDSIYNFPFWPAPQGSLVYRFDGGSYGWQFNVVFDADGKVCEVERHGIE